MSVPEASSGGIPSPGHCWGVGASPSCPLRFFSFLLSVRSCWIGLFQSYLFGKHVVPAVYQTRLGVLCIYQSPEPSWQSQTWTPTSLRDNSNPERLHQWPGPQFGCGRARYRPHQLAYISQGGRLLVFVKALSRPVPWNGGICIAGTQQMSVMSLS